MFERFTDRARRVLVLAQEEARLQNHSYIGTEHILLGLIHEEEGVAAHALRRCGITVETAARRRGSRRCGSRTPRWVAAVHAARQEGSGTRPSRSAAPRPQLYRDGTH